jgi:phosphoribosylglycinamide formyltransferase 1
LFEVEKKGYRRAAFSLDFNYNTPFATDLLVCTRARGEILKLYPNIKQTQQPLAKLVVCISGQGSNLQVLIDACKQGQLHAKIVAVIANREKIYGLERAKQADIPYWVITPQKYETRVNYDIRLATCVAALSPDWIILAGWMHVLGTHFLSHFPKRVINLHPALPGVFPGIHAIKRAFDAWKQGFIQHTGVMIHEVPDEGIDTGPVLAKIAVPIYPEDSLESLTTRVHQAEHQLLLHTMQTLVASCKCDDP